MALALQHGRTPLTEAATEKMLEKMRRDLQSIVQQRVMSLAFGDIYNNIYNLVVGQKGEEVLDLIRDTFRRMSLTRRSLLYRMATSIIKDCGMYLNHVWLVRWEKPSLTDLSEAMYERPVARRWRRALAYAKWFVRVRAWRVAFDEEYLKPGNAGALRAEEHFRECAEREAGEEEEAAAKRVKLVE